MFDTLAALQVLKDEFGEGEITWMDYDFLPGMKLRIVAKNYSVAKQFKPEELLNPTLNLEHVFRGMFTDLKIGVKRYAQDT